MTDCKIDMRLGDCLDILPTLPENSVDLIATDPPYFKVKGEAWDRQWDTAQDYLDWLDKVLAEFHRILKPNGSLYLFASPKMAARVECKVGERFNVLNRIVWRKSDGTYNEGGLWSRADKDILRRFFEQAEYILFAEHYGADGYAKGEAGYATKCDNLRGFVFEPIRAYLAGERDRAGLTTRRVAEEFQKKTGSRTVTGMAGHWFDKVQWALPTKENYQWLRETFASMNHGGKYLRREYEDLRREYEDLRRPFSVTADVPYTDVWDFPTVSFYRGKHPCEKPLEMMEHIIRTSSKEGATVLDCFMGSGATGEAAIKLKRNFFGCDNNEHWYNYSRSRIEQAQLTLPLGAA